MELQRGMIIRNEGQDESGKAGSLILSVHGPFGLCIDLYESEGDLIRSLHLDALPYVSSDFFCSFYCKELEKTYTFYPNFKTEFFNSSYNDYRVIATIEERSISSVLLSLSSIIIPKDEQYRLFMCSDSGDPHERGFWTDEEKLELIQSYRQNGAKFTAEKYNLTETTVQCYYHLYTKQLGCNIPPKHAKGFWKDPENCQRFIDIYHSEGVEGVCREFDLKKGSVPSTYYRCYHTLGIEPPKRQRRLLNTREEAQKFLDDFHTYRNAALAKMYNIGIKTIGYYTKLAQRIIDETSTEES